MIKCNLSYVFPSRYATRFRATNLWTTDKDFKGKKHGFNFSIVTGNLLSLSERVLWWVVGIYCWIFLTVKMVLVNIKKKSFINATCESTILFIITFYAQIAGQFFFFRKTAKQFWSLMYAGMRILKFVPSYE